VGKDGAAASIEVLTVFEAFDGSLHRSESAAPGGKNLLAGCEGLQ
jgi:hypothetical protein